MYYVHIYTLVYYYLLLSFVSLLRVTQSRGCHISQSGEALFPPIPTTTGTDSCVAFLSWEDFTSFPGRLASNCASLYPGSQQVIILLIFIIGIKFKISPRQDSNSRTNTIVIDNNNYVFLFVAFEGYHYRPRGRPDIIPCTLFNTWYQRYSSCR